MKDTGNRPGYLALLAAAIGLASCGWAAYLASSANGSALATAGIGAAVLAVVSLITLGRIRFARKEALEQDLYEEYRRTQSTGELFEDADEAVKLAGRANRNYVKYAVPVLTMMLGAALIVTALVVWRGWAATVEFPQARRPLPMGALALMTCLAFLVAGSYYVGASRERGCRWLRPCGAWMFFAGFLFFLGALALTCEFMDKWAAVIDIRLARFGLLALAVLGGELVVSFVIEFYRPRVPGETERPLPESRILALFTEPGGLARNVAASLDYQFGFKVSEVWFYRFLERAVVPFGIVLILTLWLQTCLVVVNPEENGIRERFGRAADQPLTPGLYLKLPAPFERIAKFPVDRVQLIAVGYSHDHDEEDAHWMEEAGVPEELRGDPHGGTIVWSRLHHKEETAFIVASNPTGTEPGATPGPARTREEGVAVYFLTASIPVYFRVNDLYDYKYRHRDAEEALRKIATQEVIRYLAGVDFHHMLTIGREEGAIFLIDKIQEAADSLQLGVEIVFVGLHGLHPPVQTGAAFDRVVAASEMRHQKKLLGEVYANKRVPQARGEAVEVVSRAEAYRAERRTVAKAEADRFRKQLLGYVASPSLFVLNTFLDVLENEGAQSRKYIVAASAGSEVFVLNLEEKFRRDLLDLDLNAQE